MERSTTRTLFSNRNQHGTQEQNPPREQRRKTSCLLNNITYDITLFYRLLDSRRLDSLRLFICISCLFSLASLALFANNLAYSAASCLALAARPFFNAISCLLRCSLCGVTNRWIFGAFVLGFFGSGFPSFGSIGLRMTYCLTSSSLPKLKSFRILPKIKME